MSHIITCKEDVELLKKYLFSLREKGIDSFLIENIMEYIIPREGENKLVNYKVKDSSVLGALYAPKYNLVYVSVTKMNEWIDKVVKGTKEVPYLDDEKLFRSYMVLYTLFHEVEHSYQFLMGKGIIDSPNTLVREGYKDITGLMIKPVTILPHPIKTTRRRVSLVKYFQNRDNYILERNANTEAFSALLDIAFDIGDENMIHMMKTFLESFLMIGYKEDTLGCMYHTFCDLYRIDIYDRISKEDIKDEDRLRYGLPIDEGTREKVLSRFSH